MLRKELYLAFSVIFQGVSILVVMESAQEGIWDWWQRCQNRVSILVVMESAQEDFASWAVPCGTAVSILVVMESAQEAHQIK